MVNPYLGFLGVIVVGAIAAACKEEIRVRVRAAVHHVWEYFCPTNDHEPVNRENDIESPALRVQQSFATQTDIEVDCGCLRYSKKQKDNIHANNEDVPSLELVEPPQNPATENPTPVKSEALAKLVRKYISTKRLAKQTQDEDEQEEARIEEVVDQVVHGQMHHLDIPNRPLALLLQEESQVYFDALSSPVHAIGEQNIRDIAAVGAALEEDIEQPSENNDTSPTILRVLAMGAVGLGAFMGAYEENCA